MINKMGKIEKKITSEFKNVSTVRTVILSHLKMAELMDCIQDTIAIALIVSMIHFP